MCGVAGYVDWTGLAGRDPTIIQAMTRTLLHRGPDGMAVWSADFAALGHARLSIVDGPGGAQPMAVDEHGRQVTVTFNGEVYNHRELRWQLSGLGHRFRTVSDTEVVLRAYLEWGPHFVDRLDGDFAIAIWDERLQYLLLARDRFGVKPLYYRQTDNGLVFGSEHKCLLAHPQVPAEADAAGLAHLVAMLPMSSPGTSVVRGVREVPAGTVARFHRGGLQIRRYWALQSLPHRHTAAETVRTVRRLLEDSVGQRLTADADVQIAAMNSGGVDSAAVAALAAQRLGDEGKELFTFDLDHAAEGGVEYEGSAFHNGRDHPYALQTAEHIKSQHTTVTVTTSELLEAHAATLAAMDLPSLTTINASLLRLFSRIGQTAKVALSGEGADEAFYGYRWYHNSGDFEHHGFPWHATYRPLLDLLSAEAAAHLRPQQYLADQYDQALATVPHLAGEDSTARRQREVGWMTNRHYLPFLLQRADRLAMAAGVEVRVPFLCHRLFAYAWNIPAPMKRAGGMAKGALRRAVEDLLPGRIAWRVKSGYPAALTAPYHQALWSMLHDVITDPAAPILQILDELKVRAFLERHRGDLTDWTPTQHAAAILEMNAWLSRVHLV
ncbi:asparagine synthase (glutamine-hydrolyzing) [Catellatospora sp. NPDC049133]|uniref:asparagine synthase (glutamine-hydrolyzing) n=1 Tax=Catellatospora sp. NPDC049133 TaxID=3155499 RepID=UPI0033FA7F27